MKKILAVLCVLALILQPVAGTEWCGHAHAEEVTSSSDLASSCELCGDKFDEQSQWVVDESGSHVKQCIHGVKLDAGEHSPTSDNVFVSISDTQHQACCLICGLPVSTLEHYALCSAPDECARCGAKGVTIESISHNWASEPEHDETHCWLVCQVCGEKGGLMEHWTHCTDTEGTCENCGAPTTNFVHGWHDALEYGYDAESHWMLCPWCGMASEEKLPHEWLAYEHDNDVHYRSCSKCNAMDGGNHTATCVNPETCVACGAEGVVIGYVDHNYSYVYDDELHWEACADCGKITSKVSHYDSCTNPGVCVICGAADVSMPWREHHWGDYEHNDTEHWQTCLDCGEITSKGEHFDSCTTPGVCVNCGATGVSMAWRYHSWADHEYDDTKHWHECLDCSSIIEEEDHYDSCTNPDVCVVCRETDVTMAYRIHNYDGEKYEHDDTEHWQVCQDCGDIINKSTHYDTCTTSGVCAYCGATGVTMASQIHNYDWESYEHDDTYHWRACKDCGDIVSKAAHSGSCANPGVCEVCGATGVTTASQSHNYDWENYEHDDTEHWFVCQDCGEIAGKLPHFDYCTNPGVCESCGATDVTIKRHNHNYDRQNREYDNARHWIVCVDCGEVTDKAVHYDTCMNPGVCVDCGATGVTMAQHEHSPDWDNHQHDDTWHWYVCLVCGEPVYKNEHYNICANPGVCDGCGATDVTIAQYDHAYNRENPEHDDTKHWWVCEDCGEIADGSLHVDSCTSRDGICDVCGASFTTGYYEHWNDHNELMFDAEKHWFVCSSCGEAWNETAHYMLCSDTKTGVCYECGEPCTQVMHEDLSDVQHDADAHWWVCSVCDQIVDKAAHVPSEDDPTKCAVCGAEIPVVAPTAEPTTEPTVEPTAEPTTEPTNEPTVAPTASPTAAPTDEPTVPPTEEPAATDEPTIAPTDEPAVTDAPAATDEPTAAPTVEPTATPIPLPTVTAAPKPVVTETPVHEHTYDVAFVSNNDGTHSKTCTADDCNETITEACTLVTTDMGLMTCTACAKCGYAVYTAKAGVAALTEGEDVPAVITRVETASIAPADETAAAVVPDDTALVVHETTFEVPVTLSEEIQGTVEKVFTAALIKDGESIQPAGQVKLRIPVDEETAATLEGKVLMLLREDGTLVEIPFEIIDGEIVFLTEEMGVFLLMAPEA